ncbi:MAG: hypothetical protein K6T86_01510 [Pirellulales bacterium]|nr:hypothetical protein [Pirellulales bacterium]
MRHCLFSRGALFSVPAAVFPLLAAVTPAHAEERVETFDRDPGWEGHNNRSSLPPAEVRQDFGYSNTRHAGGAAAGEIGGHITPAGEAAYYARPIRPATLDDRLSASGMFACTSPHFHVLVGFFNADTLNEWRTPNSIVLRLYGRGDVFYAYVEYATSRWRAGGDNPGGFATRIDQQTGRREPLGFAANMPHQWSMQYDPHGNHGGGSIKVSIDGQTAVCHLDAGHKQDGATFNRFGLLAIPKHFDQGGEVWLDDLVVNGDPETFDDDPGWEGRSNRRHYVSYDVRPRFDFGFSDTSFAGGQGRGELGGLVFRGDIRYPERTAYYADRLDLLSTDKPLRASGRASLCRGVSDSTSLLGFFHSQRSTARSDSQDSALPHNFLGIVVEGPSRDGFFFYPACRLSNGAEAYAAGPGLPHILPDGTAHDWSLEYDPGASGGQGRITVDFDGQRVQLDLAPGRADAPTAFDRFGIITTWIDGNAQRIYFDDLQYTCRQE